MSKLWQRRVRGEWGHGHGHGDIISIEADLLAKNDRLAREVRGRLDRAGIIALNLIGAPGAGKTTLLVETIRALPDLAVAVLEGDQATDHDARRIAATGCPVVQINTGSGCHLDATMIDRGLEALAPPRRSLLFVENVGNLVCPARVDVGEHAKVVVMSVTEGEDKPLKYPHVFEAAEVMVLTKTDLLPHLEIRRDRVRGERPPHQPPAPDLPGRGDHRARARRVVRLAARTRRRSRRRSPVRSPGARL